MPVIDRGVFHNFMFTCVSSCFCVTQSEAVADNDTSFASFSPFCKGVEEKGKEQQIKGKTMVQWINLLRNNSFIN